MFYGDAGLKRKEKTMPQYMMKIDLTKCQSCGTCAISCKLGNNTPKRQGGYTNNRCDFVTDTTGTPPNTKQWVLPVMCGHCTNPACVSICPVTPVADTACVGNQRKAMYKLKPENGGFVLHDDERCIGCRACMNNCPYSTKSDVAVAKAQVSILSYNTSGYDYLEGITQAIDGCTGSESEVRGSDSVLMGEVAPGYKNSWEYTAVTGVAVHDLRKKGIVDKCYLCIHRLNDSSLDGTTWDGETTSGANTGQRKPYCVLACPAKARTIVEGGSDPRQKILDDGGKVWAVKSSTLLRKVKDKLITPSAYGVIPNVYYVGDMHNR
ncbi:MAG: hypothetical protein C4560_14415 [Nitrospiraceae bacterium]|nr:MAG: hypothetical protein C4560_14415 [Nitrospiraceae bacterium]